MGQGDENNRIRKGTMKVKDRIRKELAELLDTYYGGSFAEMACDYIRCMGMKAQEVAELLEDMKGSSLIL